MSAREEGDPGEVTVKVDEVLDRCDMTRDIARDAPKPLMMYSKDEAGGQRA